MEARSFPGPLAARRAREGAIIRAWEATRRRNAALHVVLKPHPPGPRVSAVVLVSPFGRKGKPGNDYDRLRQKLLAAADIGEKSVRGPPSGQLDDVVWVSSGHQDRCAADPEKMAVDPVPHACRLERLSYCSEENRAT